MRDRRFAAFALLLASAAGLGGVKARAEDAKPLKRAHAHNDYLHKRPLLDALDHGFTSVEADVFLVDGQLLVAHARGDLKPERSLRALYLDPLRERVRSGGGSVYPEGGAFHLLIDLKSDGAPTYAALAKVLAEYADIISAVRDGKREPKAVDVSISGNRPIALVSGESLRYAGIDGRLGDLDSGRPAHLMPLVSDNWNSHFKWRGQGPISDAERGKLQDAVAKAHAGGRRIRFWATPDNAATWRELEAAGVDMINTDDLAGLEEFLRSQPPAP
ncbi:MAG: phosphatidylinositol-specific phospholipase C/glycerophosphodiester phosphodiesterase family protein [Pirellulales bacterium]